MAEFTQKLHRIPATPVASRRTAATQTSSALERRPSEAALGTLQAVLNESPRTRAIAQVQRALNTNPRVAQFAGLATTGNRSVRAAVTQRQEPEDETVLQGKLETAQRAGGYDDDDYDDYEEDFDDPDLAEYLAVPDKPTLWDFLTPEQQHDVHEMDPAVKRRRRQLEKGARRKPKKEARTEKDTVEHAKRRSLNPEAAELIEEVEGLEAELAAARRNADDYATRLALKKGSAGRFWTLIDAPDRGAEWESRKKIIDTLSTDLRVAVSNVDPVLKALAKLNYTNVSVDTKTLETAIAGMKMFTQDSPAHAKTLDGLLTRAKEQMKWLDDLIAKGSPQAQQTVIQYPNVRIHKCIKKCPNYANIPFAELDAQTATGTHGKSPRDAFVHKKVAGGCAITITYRGTLSYVTDWGNKSPNSNSTTTSAAVRPTIPAPTTSRRPTSFGSEAHSRAPGRSCVPVLRSPTDYAARSVPRFGRPSRNTRFSAVM